VNAETDLILNGKRGGSSANNYYTSTAWKILPDYRVSISQTNYYDERKFKIVDDNTLEQLEVDQPIRLKRVGPVPKRKRPILTPD
jgi:hypothetical protein